MKQKRTSRYSMTLQWSDEDGLFLVAIPEFGDRVIIPCTHGKNRTEAIQRGKSHRMYVEAWKAGG